MLETAIWLEKLKHCLNMMEKQGVNSSFLEGLILINLWIARIMLISIHCMKSILILAFLKGVLF